MAEYQAHLATTGQTNRTRGGTDPDSPAYRSQANRDQELAVTIVRDVYGGTLVLRDKGETYLPRFPLESQAGYETRRRHSNLFNAFRRTVGGLTGMIFRKDVLPNDDVMDEVLTHLEDVDLAGRDLSSFARGLTTDALIDGHALIFVDRPPASKREVTRLQESRGGRRPYWIAIQKQDLLSYRGVTVGGRSVLTQIAFRQVVRVPDGRFGERDVEQVRVYDLPTDDDGRPVGAVRFSLWELGPDSSRYEELPDAGGEMMIDEIPLVAVYADRDGDYVSCPPLLDLAIENIEHYQVRSDRKNALHIAGVPIPIFTGMGTTPLDNGSEDGPLAVGSDHGLQLPAGADAKYLEPAGTALDASRQELQDIERRMAVLGLSMLMSETRQAETATSKRIDKSESDSQLSLIALGLETGLNEALRLHAKWMGQEAAGTVSVNRDFMDQLLDPQLLSALADMVGRGGLSLETLWEIMVQGDILPAGFDPEQERDRLAGLDQLLRFLRPAVDNGDQAPAKNGATLPVE